MPQVSRQAPREGAGSGVPAPFLVHDSTAQELNHGDSRCSDLAFVCPVRRWLVGNSVALTLMYYQFPYRHIARNLLKGGFVLLFLALFVGVLEFSAR